MPIVKAGLFFQQFMDRLKMLIVLLLSYFQPSVPVTTYKRMNCSDCKF